MSTEQFKKDLDRASVKALDRGAPRRHLGASQVGARCARQVWYSFRWFWIVEHGGRMERLFNRGHEEEIRVMRWLRSTDGVEVRDRAERLVNVYNPDADEFNYTTIPWDQEFGPLTEDCSDSPYHIAIAESEHIVDVPQWGFKEGFFSGSGDGLIRGVEKWFPEVAGLGWGLFECKTANEKSFNNLSTKGVLSHSVTYYAQAQIYMAKLGLTWCLHITVNKNNDDIYVEIIHLKPEVADHYTTRAHSIIAAKQPPPRITSDPSWFECKFCDFREICHYQKEPQKNCRSCAFGEAGGNTDWVCRKFEAIVPIDFEPKGCGAWESAE